MKLLQLILILKFCFTQPCKAQTDHGVIDLIDSLVSFFQKGGIRHYSDKMNSIWIKPVLTSISQKKIYSIYGSNPDSIILTSDEKKYLQKQLYNLSKFRWRDSLIENSKRVDRDSLQMVIKRVTKHIYDSLNQVSSQEFNTYLIKNGPIWGFTFSNPIFLRNNSICLIFFMNYYNSAGSTRWTFYRKTDSIWKEWIVLRGGEW